jgi:ssDNA-binding Zn-finger/Zn-ribbon topoisomerase 1
MKKRRCKDCRYGFRDMLWRMFSFPRSHNCMNCDRYSSYERKMNANAGSSGDLNKGYIPVLWWGGITTKPGGDLPCKETPPRFL